MLRADMNTYPNKQYSQIHVKYLSSGYRLARNKISVTWFANYFLMFIKWQQANNIWNVTARQTQARTGREVRPSVNYKERARICDINKVMSQLSKKKMTYCLHHRPNDGGSKHL
jgi:hypothetical protein